jgi:hypothetical protein
MTDHTWISDSSKNSSDSTAWSPATIPAAGDNLIFNSTHTGQCTLDETKAYGDLTMGASSGIVLLGAADPTFANITQNGGTITGNTSHWITVSGNLQYQRGGITTDTVQFKLTGTGKNITPAGSGWIAIWSLWITGSYSISVWCQINNMFQLDVGASLTTGTAEFAVTNAAISNSVINGTVNSGGNGADTGFELIQSSETAVRTFRMNGTFNGQLHVRHHNSNSTFGTISLLSPITVNGTVYVISERAGQFETLNLNGNKLTCQALTIAALAIVSSSIPGGSIKATDITVAATGSLDRTNIKYIQADGNVDLSAGTSTEGTETWIFGGAAKTVKLAAGQKLYNVICKASAAGLAWASNVTIDNVFAHVNPVGKGAYTLTLTDPTKEYTGMRRPIRLPLKKLDIGQVCAQCGWMRNLGALL